MASATAVGSRHPAASFGRRLAASAVGYGFDFAAVDGKSKTEVIKECPKGATRPT